MSEELDLEETLQKLGAEIIGLHTQLAIKDKALRRIEFLILDDGLTKRDPYDQRWLEPRCLACGRTAEEKHLADCEIGQALSPNTTEAKDEKS